MPNNTTPSPIRALIVDDEPLARANLTHLLRNEPDVEPESGKAWSSRNLVACLREGAARFGWSGRDPTPGVRRDGDWLVGTGVASSTYPTYRSGSRASVAVEPDGRFTVGVCAADLGTGARTVLTQIAADALGVSPDRIAVELGDSSLPRGPVAGGSMGTGSWGGAVVRACEALLAKLGELGALSQPGGPAAVDIPDSGVEAFADAYRSDEPKRMMADFLAAQAARKTAPPG